jgi:hypothetical protein
MLITITRLDSDGRYETRITRDDGVSYSLRGVGHNFELPHDLAHFVIERALQIDTGFWGSIADGAVFATMKYEGGRRKPHATERSKAVMKANSRQLTAVEVVVGVFNDAIEQGHGEASPILLARLKERCGQGQKIPAAIRDRVSHVYSGYRELLALWNNTPVAGTLGLQWKSKGKRK